MIIMANTQSMNAANNMAVALRSSKTGAYAALVSGTPTVNVFHTDEQDEYDVEMEMTMLGEWDIFVSVRVGDEMELDEDKTMKHLDSAAAADYVRGLFGFR